MKLSKYILMFALLCGASSCLDLDLPPINVVDNEAIFGNENGIKSYMARMYRNLPIEDFRYSPNNVFNNEGLTNPPSAITGEAISRNQRNARTEEVRYWGDAYQLIRDANYFIETLPGYESNYSKDQLNQWKGEALFVRGATYFALAKRYGGVPLVDEVLKYPEQPIEELHRARASEEDTYNKIAKDFDDAYALLPEKIEGGRANKYVAAGFKARAMLYAGTIAKYNQVAWYDGEVRLCGIPEAKAADFFKKSFEAAKLLENNYSLYKNEWKADDKEAQFQNYSNLFTANSSSENIFVRLYKYPDYVHSIDVLNVPVQFMVDGYAAMVCPTLEFVEMFDGLPVNSEGKVQVFDQNGKYAYYENPFSFFQSAEPRLRATVLVPGDKFKDQEVEIYRGIYVGPTAGGIAPFHDATSVTKYHDLPIAESGKLLTSKDNVLQNVVTLPNGPKAGTKMNAAGKNGPFDEAYAAALLGFLIRKGLDPSLAAGNVKWNYSDLHWIEMRYAEILLTRAEAAYELAELGGSVSGVDLKQDAFECIKALQERAGANVLANKSELSLDKIRKERRKELSFENKTWWDLKRWRIADKEMDNTIYRCLVPFYASEVDKWFFDTKKDDDMSTYTFQSQWYYQQIPTGDITKSPIIKQNQGY